MGKVRRRPEVGQEIDPPAVRRPAAAAGHKGRRAPLERGAYLHPAVYLEESVIIGQTSFVRDVLRRCGVAPADLDDVTQETIVGAWCSMKAGRFRPAPDVALRETLRSWLAGVAFRQASHYRDRAHRRREQIVVNPDVAFTGAVPSPEQRIVARNVLKAIGQLRPELQEVLASSALGMRTTEIAAELGIPLGTAFSRLRNARRMFARALARWRR